MCFDGRRAVDGQRADLSLSRDLSPGQIPDFCIHCEPTQCIKFAALALDPMIHAPEAYMDSIAGCFCTRGIRDWELPACMQLNSVEFNGNIQNSFQRIQLHVAAGGEVE